MKDLDQVKTVALAEVDEKQFLLYLEKTVNGYNEIT